MMIEVRFAKLVTRFGLVLLFGFVAPLVGRAEDERIVAYHSEIVIDKDTSLTVTETITVHAERRRISRGIFRDFPQLYGSASTGVRRARGFEVLEVTKDGKPEDYVVEKLKGGKRVRIGSADHMLSLGKHTYQIKYQTTRQLGYFGQHDELYWNVTGNGWNFRMDKVEATVTLPDGAKVISAEAYTGKIGSKERDYEKQVDVEGGQASFQTSRTLRPHEGITVVVMFPKGHVDYAADRPSVFSFIFANLGLLFIVLGLLASLVYFVVRWVQVGKDPAAGTIIPRYEPPEGFSPAAVRMLSRMEFDEKCFSAAVIGLAAKGAITIEESGKTYRLVFVKSEAKGRRDHVLLPDEEVLLKKILSGTLSIELKQENHAIIGVAKESLRIRLAQTLEKSHFIENGNTWILGLLLFLLPTGLGFLIFDPEVFGLFAGSAIASAIAVTGLSVAVSSWRSGTWSEGAGLAMLLCSAMLAVAFMVHAESVGYWLAAVTPCGFVLLAIFLQLMSAPTRLGRKRLDEIDGFKLYLSVAEKERMNFENPPERTPQLFEKFLPYALALDVEQQWSEQFTQVLADAATSAQLVDSGSTQATAYSPSFYQGSNFKGLAAGAVATAIGSTLTSNLASASVSPSSNSGSSIGGFSSGGGGGGSSGGGGGGGGGGGW